VPPGLRPHDDREPVPEGLLVPGDTCWRRTRAGRVAFLVDADDYFAALADALDRARHAVWMIGWDFHSRVRLRPEEPGGERAQTLVSLLDALARKRRDLRIRVLGWDFAMLYALEREPLPLVQFAARAHGRVDFELDGEHPPGASHHQKLVVVDDAVAFVGGIDLTSQRWDTRAHRPGDPRRVLPDGTPYGPFHDAQLAVDGETAAALAALARERWRRATGEATEQVTPPGDPWPASLEPDLRDVQVGLARTEAAWDGRPEVREVEALHLRSIASARRWIYLENQYFTAEAITEALAGRLGEPDGPEVVLVLPQASSGWLERNTMDALRRQAVSRLRQADVGGRLRIYSPRVVPEGGSDADTARAEPVYVHAKIVVIDDVAARVGSANLSNRSLGLDSECDAVVVADGSEDARRGIAAFRDDLLAEHLGAERAEVEAAIAETGSLVAAIERLRGPGRTLEDLHVPEPDWSSQALQEIGLADPEHPVPLQELVDEFLEDDPDEGPSARASWTRVSAVVLAAGLLLLAWRATPASEWMDPERIAGWVQPLGGSPEGIAVATLLFALASLLMVPVTAMAVAVALLLGPGTAFLVSLAGSLVGAAGGYLAGRLFWRDAVRRLAGERLNALSRRLGKRGILSTAMVRVVPIAPFTVVNLVAGASHVSFRDFVVGTGVGMMPGLLALTWAADLVAAAVREPRLGTWLGAVGALALAVALIAWLRLAVRRRAERRDTGAEGS